MAFTLVSFHAHPDDEVLLTGGTLARASAEGHRVVLVVATNGEAGLAASGFRADGSLGRRRVAELEQSAAALGCARLVLLDYPDSGWQDSARSGGFSSVAVDAAADRLARVLRQEDADALTTYDAAGGYGHLDHVQVHRVGAAAAALADTSLVLQATIDRRLIQRAIRLVQAVPFVLPEVRVSAFADSYSAAITHRVDVRAHIAAKRAAMAAHASQATADSGQRTLQLLLRLPDPIFRKVLGREWFLEAGRAPGEQLDDIFASLR